MTLSFPPTRDPAELRRIARALRKQVVRMVARTGQGYVQQGLGAADLFTALYFAELRQRPEQPDWPGRDRFILSTAHNTAIFYATLARAATSTPRAWTAIATTARRWRSMHPSAWAP